MSVKLSPAEQLALQGQRIPLEQRQEIIDAFHRLSYDEARRGRTWHSTHWQGAPVLKWPGDLWLYAETIWDVKPKTIIETGTAHGGSALFFAHLLDQLGQGFVITIDLNPMQPQYPAHKRIRYVPQTSSLDWIAPPGLLAPVMVILDSDHTQAHVRTELDRFCAGVSPGSYLVVEDSNVGGHPCNVEHGPGPHEAIESWLPQHPEYRIDANKADKFLFSYHTWLRKVAR